MITLLGHLVLVIFAPVRRVILKVLTGFKEIPVDNVNGGLFLVLIQLKFKHLDSETFGDLMNCLHAQKTKYSMTIPLQQFDD
jgi:hypothetical protein